MRIEILTFDGFDEIDVFGPFEVLNSSAVADRVARSLEYARQGRVWHAPPRPASPWPRWAPTSRPARPPG